jgi:hypothetical protein
MKKSKKEKKKAGIWLDHAVAHLIKVKHEKMVVENIFSGVESQVRYKGETGTGTKLGKTRSTNKEHGKHRREENQLHQYYKTLAGIIQKYDTIYLFGPSTAKKELMNWIRDKKEISGKTFIMDSAEELSFNQMVAKVKTTLGGGQG